METVVIVVICVLLSCFTAAVLYGEQVHRRSGRARTAGRR